VAPGVNHGGRDLLNPDMMTKRVALAFRAGSGHGAAP